MHELLPDNIMLAERLEALPVSVRTSSIPQREIASVKTWTCSFATYIAIVAEAHPEKVRDMLAYMHLIVREAQKFSEGVGWLTYDSVFRQNNQGLEARWDKLDPSLHTAYIGGQGTSAAPPCRHCRGVDHSSAGCALSPLTPVTKYGNQTKSEQAVSERKPRQPNIRPAGGFICRSWNAGKCRFSGTCYYRHVCSTCNEQHMAGDCPHLQSQRVEGRR